MSTTPNDPRREYPNTYIVRDRSNVEEMTRLAIQDQMLNARMGGVLPEQTDLAGIERVLDVGCGTGGWLIEVARTYPTMTMLVGVDASRQIIDYARAQAEEQHVGDRVEFQTMDALQMLEFPTRYFDLMNMRFGSSFLRTWEWPDLLHELRRVTRPGGVIRITEGGMITQSSSTALTRLFELVLDAFYNAGHSFTPTFYGVTSELADLLTRYGLEDIQTRTYNLEYHGGTNELQPIYEDARYGFRVMVPFLRKWSRMPEDYETLYQQALSEMQQPDFVATQHLLTAWGTKTLGK